MTKKTDIDVFGSAHDKCDAIPKQSDKGQQDTKGQQEKDSVHKCLNQSPFDFVAAIDLGTSTTGCGYSTTSGFKSNPLNISCELIWNEHGSVSQDMSKTKTCILLDKKGQFISFGYDAEYEYTQLKAKHEYENYCFFHNFKMDLYKNKVR